MAAHRIITQTEASQALGITRQAIKEALQRGRIAGIQIGNEWFCDKFSVARYGTSRQYNLDEWIASWPDHDQQKFRQETTQTLSATTPFVSQETSDDSLSARHSPRTALGD